MSLDINREGKSSTALVIPYSSHDSAYGQIEVPIGVIRNGEGPTILLVAGNHGDEFEGQFALWRLFREIDARQVTGRLIIVPAANPPAVYSSRRLSPLDQGNLNRVFSESAPSGPTAAIARVISDALLPAVDYLVDLHSGGTSLEYLPCAILQRTSDPDLDRRQKEMADAFGAPQTLIYDALPGIASSLTGTAIRRGIPSLGTELGGGGTSTPRTLAIGYEGVASLLQHLGFRPGAPARRTSEYLAVDTAKDFLRAPDDGFFEPAASLGDMVRTGQLAGYLHRFSELGEAPRALHFAAEGKIMCRRTHTKSGRGDCLFHTARHADRTVSIGGDHAAQ